MHPHPCTIFEPDAAQCHRAAFSKPCSDNRGCYTSAVEPVCDLFASCVRDLRGLRDESSMSKSRPNFRILRANVSCPHAQMYDDHITSLCSSRLRERGNQQRGRSFHRHQRQDGRLKPRALSHSVSLGIAKPSTSAPTTTPCCVCMHIRQKQAHPCCQGEQTDGANEEQEQDPAWHHPCRRVRV